MAAGEGSRRRRPHDGGEGGEGGDGRGEGGRRRRGVERPLYFLRHAKPEEAEPASRSHRCNPHEAKFLAAFAAYLLRQGYAPSELAILTPRPSRLKVPHQPSSGDAGCGLRTPALHTC